MLLANLRAVKTRRRAVVAIWHLLEDRASVVELARNDFLQHSMLLQAMLGVAGDEKSTAEMQKDALCTVETLLADSHVAAAVLSSDYFRPLTLCFDRC